MNGSPYKEGILFEQIRQWLGNDPKITDELPIISGQSKESAKITDGSWWRPILDGLNHGRIGGQTGAADHMAQVRDLPLSKLALGKLNLPVLCGQPLKN